MRVLIFAALAFSAMPAAAAAQVCLYGGPNSSAACGPQYNADRDRTRDGRASDYAPATSRATPARPVTAQDDAPPPARFVDPALLPSQYGPQYPYDSEYYGEADRRTAERQPLPTYGQDREPRLAGGPPPARLAAPPPRSLDPYSAPRRDYAGQGYYGRDYEAPESRRPDYRERGYYGYDREDYREARGQEREVLERREYGYFHAAPRYEARREYRYFDRGDYRYSPQRIYGRTLNPASWGARDAHPAERYDRDGYYHDRDGYYYEERCYDRDPRGGWDHCESWDDRRGQYGRPDRVSLDASALSGGVGVGVESGFPYGGGGRVIIVDNDSRFASRRGAKARSIAFADASARASVHVHRGGRR